MFIKRIQNNTANRTKIESITRLIGGSKLDYFNQRFIFKLSRYVEIFKGRLSDQYFGQTWIAEHKGIE